jgi:DNA primase catalytic core
MNDGLFYGEDQVAALKAHADLVDVASDYAPVQKEGKNHKTLCPAHADRHASAVLYPDGTWHCFVCQGHGDTIKLVMLREHLDFKDAVPYLARRTGFNLKPLKTPGKSDGPTRERMLAAWAAAVPWWQEQLAQHPEATAAREYLAGRGLTKATLDAFKVGYAPGHATLADHLRGLGFLPAELLDAGLVVERNGELRDATWARITFPILDRAGRPVAVTARVLPAAEAKAKEEGRGVGKYVNTGETRLWNKGASLFNLRQAREASSKAHRLVVVEGPVDAMAAHQAGVPETIASLGTALTPEHAKLLGQALGDEGRLILLPDTDAPGLAAAERAIATLWAAGLTCRCATIEGGKDLADLVKDGKGDAIAPAIEAASRDLAWLLARRPKPTDLIDALDLADQVLEPLAKMPDRQARELLAAQVSAHFGLGVPLLRARLTALAGEQEAPETPRVPAGAGASAGNDSARPDVEMDGGFHKAVVATLDGFLREEKVAPDAVGGWRHEAGGRAVVKQRNLVRRFLLRNAHKFQALSMERVTWTLEALVEGRRVERRREILGRLVGKPANPAGLAAARAWLKATTGSDDATDLQVLLHFIWQVKRHACEREVEFDLMPILYGQAHGSGKSRAIHRLTIPLAELAAPIKAEQITDQRSSEMLSDFLIGVWDELSGGSRADVAALKHAITATTVSYRELGGHATNVLPKRLTLIASSNEPVDTIITDTTGARRYYQWNALPLCDWAAINAIDPLLIWSAVSEDDAAPYHQAAVEIRHRQSGLVHRDAVDLWLESETWDELQLTLTDQPYNNGPTIRTIPQHKRDRGESFEDLLGRYGHWARLVGQPPQAANKVGARLRQLGFRLMRPHLPGSKRAQPRRYYLPEQIPETWAAASLLNLVPEPAVLVGAGAPATPVQGFDDEPAF